MTSLLLNLGQGKAGGVIDIQFGPASTAVLRIPNIF